MMHISMVTILKMYNNDELELQVKIVLKCLSLQKSIKKFKTTYGRFSLTGLAKIEHTLTPHSLVELRRDAHEIMYLKQAIISYDWSKIPISQIMIH